MQLQESGEMYLETILILSNRMEHVRSIDISDYMNYSKPSISKAMGHLKKGGYVVVDSNGYITLTETGLDIATKIYERHNVLSQWLISLGVDEETAIEDACRMEHDISDTSFAAVKRHLIKEHKMNI